MLMLTIHSKQVMNIQIIKTSYIFSHNSMLTPVEDEFQGNFLLVNDFYYTLKIYKSTAFSILQFYFFLGEMDELKNQKRRQIIK